MRDEVMPELPVTVFGLPVNWPTVFMSVVVAGILVLIAYVVGRRVGMVPRRLQAAVEAFYGFFIDLVAQALGKERARKFFPLYSSLFLFLWFSNMIGIVPIGRVEIGGEPYVDVNGNGVYDSRDFFEDENGDGRRNPGFVMPGWQEPTRDMNTTIGMAILFAFIAHLTQLRTKKPFILGYIKDYFSPIPLMFPLNVVSRIVEMVSTSMRLYGNIFGGAVIILIASFFTAGVVLPLPLAVFFGLFVGTIQAFVFTMLWIAYLAVTIQE